MSSNVRVTCIPDLSEDPNEHSPINELSIRQLCRVEDVHLPETLLGERRNVQKYG